MRVGVGLLAGAVFLAAGAYPGDAAEGGVPIREVKLTGDSAVLAREGLLDDFRNSLAGRTLTPAEIQDQAKQLRDRLRERGYLLASVRTPPADYASGIVPIDIDAGRFGKLAFTGPGGTPFEGRWFSADQLKYRFSGLAEGEPFQESVFYQHVMGVNTHPDLVVDPALSVRREVEDGRAVRYADLSCAVTESFPLHAILTVDNDGVEASGEWQATALIQYLNLTRHDDILSVWLGPVSEDDGSSQSAAAGYLRPRLSGKGGATLLYGGYSDVESEEVADLFTLQGKGWFAGVREDWRLVSGPAREVVFSAGVAWREQEETLDAADAGVEGDTRTVSVLPLSVGVRVAPFRYDGLGGRTFFEAEAVCGPGDLTGSEDDIEEFRPGAESTYLVGRLKAARLQPLASQARDRAGEAWLLFGRVEAQVANGALLGAEQLALGGRETVRGFPERIMMGDQGGDATLEVRSPLARIGGKSHLQGVLFADAGHAIPEGDGDLDSVTMAGAGAGFRLALGAHAQFLADYGLAVAGSDDVEEQTGLEVDSGRLHVCATVQF
jgi:hemolysin activation/secretion protein